MLGQYTILRALPSLRMAEPFNPGHGFAHATSIPGLDGAAAAPGIKIERAELNHDEVLDAAQDPQIRGIARTMPTTLIHPFEVAAQAEANSVWGLAATGADVSAFNGAGVVVAILDTGIDATHPAFAGVTLTQKNFTVSGDADGQGHGTHCAGTIFGRDIGNTRIGIARGVTQALIGKVLDDTGAGSSDALFSAIPWALQGGASVISMSIGFDFPGYAQQLQLDGMPPPLATSMALEAYRGNMRMFDALMAMVQAQSAFSPSAVVIAAAGNESHVELKPDYRIGASLPAAAQGVVAVGAVERVAAGLRIADFSNTFAQICAPGVDIVSAKRGGGTASMSGTSMACPHVAGVAALWWQSLRKTHGTASPSLVLSKLFGEARPDALLATVAAADRGAGLLTSP